MVVHNRYAVDNEDDNGRTPLMYATIKNKVPLYGFVSSNFIVLFMRISSTSLNNGSSLTMIVIRMLVFSFSSTLVETLM